MRDPYDFATEYQCVPMPEKDKDLFKLAKMYHESCDGFDDSVCTDYMIIEGRKVSMSANARERLWITNNSDRMRKWCIEKGRIMDFEALEVTRAISDYGREKRWRR